MKIRDEVGGGAAAAAPGNKMNKQPETHSEKICPILLQVANKKFVTITGMAVRTCITRTIKAKIADKYALV